MNTSKTLLCGLFLVSALFCYKSMAMNLIENFKVTLKCTKEKIARKITKYGNTENIELAKEVLILYIKIFTMGISFPIIFAVINQFLDREILKEKISQ